MQQSSTGQGAPVSSRPPGPPQGQARSSEAEPVLPEAVSPLQPPSASPHTSGPAGIPPAVVPGEEEDESPVAGKLFDGQVFDLTELLRQYILLNEPTQPLPPLTGDGRCAHCLRTPAEVLEGATETTEAEETPINPAFAKLGQLLKKDGS